MASQPVVTGEGRVQIPPGTPLRIVRRPAGPSRTVEQDRPLWRMNFRKTWGEFEHTAGILEPMVERGLRADMESAANSFAERIAPRLQTERLELEKKLGDPVCTGNVVYMERVIPRLAAIGAPESFGALAKLLGQNLPRDVHVATLDGLAQIAKIDSFGWGRDYISPIEGHSRLLCEFIAAHMDDPKLVGAAARVLVSTETTHIASDMIRTLIGQAEREGHAESTKALSMARENPWSLTRSPGRANLFLQQ